MSCHPLTTGRWPLLILASLLCSACAIGPKYQVPVVAQTPPAFKEIQGNDQWKIAQPSDGLMKGKWWEVLGDPQLNALEEQVNINNQNVKQAEAQFRQARALVDAAHANYYPTIGSSPGVTQTDSGRLGRGSTFSLPIAASWEPDLWGRVRLAVENAAENAQVSAADLENIRLSAQATLATDYFLIAANDMQAAVLKDTIEAYQKNLELTNNRFNGGVASKSDVTLAQTQLYGAQAQATDLHIARAQDEHAIAVLIGKAPSSLTIPTTYINGPPAAIPTVVPSRLLERRPDIAANERQVAAANANIGIAQTAYYPTLTLSASAGFASTALQDLFNWASRSWSAGPGLSETLFDFGRRGAQVQVSQAAYDATVAAYRQTTLAAFEEVEDDLASLRYLAEESEQQQEAVTAAEISLALEIDRYKAGTDSYLNVITTQEIALSDEQAAVTILQRRLVAAVDLVKAMGGGWDNSTLPSLDQMRSAALADPKNSTKVAQPVNAPAPKPVGPPLTQ
jgi:NodT family efflux transporter outer membrane factor (OMF) lipoprotein